MYKSPYCRHLWYIQNIIQWGKNDMKALDFLKLPTVPYPLPPLLRLKDSVR